MIKIAILGCGVVGSGVIRLLRSNCENITKQLGDDIVIEKVLARTKSKALDLGIDESNITDSIDNILNDNEIQVVVELMGGTTTAYDYVRKAILHRKHIVTANKDMIANHMKELTELCQQNKVSFHFEASVGGGIPLIMPLQKTLAGNKMKSMMGILNGTTNYILTKMMKESKSYEDALAEAQKLGFAEADPSSDVLGSDAARKIAILSSLAFHTSVTYDDVYHEGITQITAKDIDFAKRSGMSIKLLAISKESDGEIENYVRPALIPESHPLASVNNSYNAVFLDGDAVGNVMLYGRGAGSLPTASSVVGDIMDCCANLHNPPISAFSFYGDTKIRNIEDTESEYFIHLVVSDKPRVLSGISGVLGENNISLASVIQDRKTNEEEKLADLMILTHKAKEMDLRASVKTLLTMNYVRSISTMICIGGEE